MKKTLTIEGMSCEHCTNAVEKALLNLDGVNSVNTDLVSKTAEVEGDNLNDPQLKEVVKESGYEVVNIKTV